jgi:putative transcriptional regulator
MTAEPEPGRQSLRGRLLVATPGLIDPNFFRAVLLVVEHTAEGAAGVILNRPSETEIDGTPLDSWKELAADPPLVFVGGPVAPDSAVCLARAAYDARPDGWEPVVGGLGVVDLSRGIDDFREGLDRLRVFAGYAGWGEGQLEAELNEGSWYILDADPEDALTSMPLALWRFVLRRQRGKLALVANFPTDPSMN